MTNNNFEEYGFTADFKGEIFAKREDFANDIYYFGSVTSDETLIPVCWDDDGFCFTGYDYDKDNQVKEYKLTPIKKEWYEIEENFPCIIVDSSGNFDVTYERYRDIENHRPATKEEVLRLVVDED